MAQRWAGAAPAKAPAKAPAEAPAKERAEAGLRVQWFFWGLGFWVLGLGLRVSGLGLGAIK